MTSPLDDKFYWMQGDGMGAVMLQCRICNRQGLPVVYLTDPGDKAYVNTDVVVTSTLEGLLDGAEKHLRRHLEALRKDSASEQRPETGTA